MKDSCIVKHVIDYEIPTKGRASHQHEEDLGGLGKPKDRRRLSVKVPSRRAASVASAPPGRTSARTPPGKLLPSTRPGSSMSYNPTYARSGASSPSSRTSRASRRPPSARYTRQGPLKGLEVNAWADEAGRFTRQGWHIFSKKIFLNTTKLVDETTAQLVNAARRFNKVPIELRELSLTMAVLDHSLIEYARTVRKTRTYSARGWGDEDVAPMNTWRHPGGLVSFSEILTVTLKDAVRILAKFKRFSTFISFLKAFKTVWIGSFLGVVFLLKMPLEAETHAVIRIFQTVTVDLTKIILDFLRHEVAPLLPGSATLTKTLFRFALAQWQKFFALFLRIKDVLGEYIDPDTFPPLISRARYLFLIWVLYYIYLKIQGYYRNQLKDVNEKMNKLLQYWHLCQSSISSQQNRLDRNLEYRFSKKTKSRSEAAFDRWTLGLVAPSASLRSCFWYKSSYKMMLVKRGVDITYATTSLYYEIFGSRLNFIPIGALFACYFMVNPHDAEVRSNQFLASPDLRLLCFVWHSLDCRFARWVTLRLMPCLGLAPAVPVLSSVKVPAPTEERERFKDSLNHDIKVVYANVSSRRIQIRNRTSPRMEPDQKTESAASPRDPRSPQSSSSRSNESVLYLSEAHTSLNEIQDASKIGFRAPTSTVTMLFMSANQADKRDRSMFRNPLSWNRLQRADSITRSIISSPRNKSPRDVVMFIHGGGFLANFCASDMRFLNIWANQVQVPILNVDYKLSPESSFPDPLVDCYMAYRRIVKGGLGFPVRKIQLVATSNGALLAAALVLKLLADEKHPKLKLPMPAQLVLACPILNLRPEPTASRLLFMMDPIVSNNLFSQIRKLYLPSTESYDTNMYVSPLVAAPDCLLRRFPPTGIVCGGFDPFCDDAIDFAHRLTDNGVPVFLERFKSLPHEFLAFGHVFPEAERAIKLCGTWMQQAFNEP